MPSGLSTHVLDTMHGCAAQGMKVELWSLDGDERELVTAARTNADGRTEQPLLAPDEIKPGQYELVFFVGDYFAQKSAALPKIRFLDKVPVRFGIADGSTRYHVPLLCSPWAYSTYRGT